MFWLSGRKENVAGIEKQDCMTEVLLFKQAIALGWDCPRACVLLIFRELQSQIFKADNLHALCSLCYTHEGKFDVIYIDPPYNTGARDWKYNNDYVDDNDSYRHSKWLTLMENRLKVAKKLLNPEDSVLILTIDDNEYLHIGCVLEQLFPGCKITMVSSVINPSGKAKKGGVDFSRTDEYIYFVQIGRSIVLPRFEKLKSVFY